MMQVTPIAVSSLINLVDESEEDIDVIEALGLPRFGEEQDVERLIEFAGRTCYKSYSRPNAKTADPDDYIRNIIKQQHFSVLEHASVTFYVTGVSRNMLLELERHRHLSFSVVSQRFVNSENTALVYPPSLQEMNENDDEVQLAEVWATSYMAAQDAYVQTVQVLEAQGKTRKQAREAARAILPGGLETTFIVSGNVRAWRDMLSKRYSLHADKEIFEFACAVLAWLQTLAPVTVEDFVVPEE